VRYITFFCANLHKELPFLIMKIVINLGIVNNNVCIDYLKQDPITILVEIEYCFENSSEI